MLTGHDIHIEIDPKARIQGLLETVDRYLTAYRESEQRRQALFALCSTLKGVLEDLHRYVQDMPLTRHAFDLDAVLTAVLDAISDIPSPSTADGEPAAA